MAPKLINYLIKHIIKCIIAQWGASEKTIKQYTHTVNFKNKLIKILKEKQKKKRKKTDWQEIYQQSFVCKFLV